MNYTLLNNQKLSGSTAQILVNSISQNNKYQIDQIENIGDCEKIKVDRSYMEQNIVDRISSKFYHCK